MTLSDATQTELLATHPKPIAHMWRQIQEHRFGLVFGAGISINLDLPSWDDLITRIAADPQVKGRAILNDRKGTEATSLAEILFQHFASQVINNDRAITQSEVRRMWRDVVRKQLYSKVRKKDYLSQHPYIRKYLPLIRQIPMTVTYNFDNFIERFLEEEHRATGSSGEGVKPYEVIWRPDIHPRLKRGVVYHPNGFLPDNPAEPASDGLIFRENEFADQLMESISGRYASLLHFLSRHTCLLMGLSLNDGALKHLLRQSAKLSPGHFHYYIDYEDKENPTPQTVKKAVFEANFDVHNLITLFLTEQQIAALGDLLTMNEQDLSQVAHHAQTTNLRYNYFITGVPGAGKSSSISYLRSFITYDEWLDARLPDMSKWPKSLAQRKVREIDDWVARQFEHKNLILSNSSKKIGLHILDRCMLDPMSFKDEDDRPERARTLLNKVCGENRSQAIQDGMIVLLDGDSEVFEERCLAAGKDFSSIQLKEMHNVLKKAYHGKHLHVIDTRRKSRAAVIKEIVRLMFTGQYEQMNIKRRLQRIEAGKAKW